MGRDITIQILDKKTAKVKAEYFAGRCYEWFNQLRGEDTDAPYCCFEEILKYRPDSVFGDATAISTAEAAHKELLDSDYFDIHYIKIADFVDWMDKYMPWHKAGWTSTYDRWAYNQNEIIPGEVYKYRKDAEIDYGENDCVFLEYTEEDLTTELYIWIKKVLLDKVIAKEDVIIFYFDC